MTVDPAKWEKVYSLAGGDLWRVPVGIGFIYRYREWTIDENGGIRESSIRLAITYIPKKEIDE